MSLSTEHLRIALGGKPMPSNRIVADDLESLIGQAQDRFRPPHERWRWMHRRPFPFNWGANGPLWWLLICLLPALLLIGAARADEHHSNPWLLSWIPATCCVTNDCCWEIQEREVRSLPGDEWEIKSTGQVRKRTAFSPDGKFYRCACDYDNVDKVWNRHQGAKTRCIFVPQRLF